MNKYKNFHEFSDSCQSITTKIRSLNKDAIVDGIINEDKYYHLGSNSPRILWILKEPNTSDLQWDYQNLLSTNQLSTSRNYNIQTIRRVLYTSYGILNNFMEYSSMPFIYEEQVFGIGESIAYINVNKNPGAGGQSIENLLAENAKVYQEIVNTQIEIYNPDIIILGNVARFLDRSLFNNTVKSYTNESTCNTALYECSDRIIIDAYHPGYIMKEAVYCDEIIEGAKRWWSKHKKA